RAGAGRGGPGPDLDVVLVDPAFGPDLPGEILRLENLSAGDPAFGNEHKFLRRRGPGERLRLGPRILLREERSDQQGGTAGEGQGDDKENQSACAHCLLPAEWKHNPAQVLVREYLNCAGARLLRRQSLRPVRPRAARRLRYGPAPGAPPGGAPPPWSPPPPPPLNGDAVGDGGGFTRS